MKKAAWKETTLHGLMLKEKTIHANGRSGIDCGRLWRDFDLGKYAENMPGRLGDEVFAVYHRYDGNHEQPFSYFVGCRVAPDTELLPQLHRLTIPEGLYLHVTAAGKMPRCMSDAWQEIHRGAIPRSYLLDFEVYDERSNDWSNATIDIYLSVISESLP